MTVTTPAGLDAGKRMLSQSKFYSGYSRWLEAEQRYETWEEAVARVMNMHREKYADRMTPELAEAIDFAEAMYRQKAILGAQRALQYGGPQIFQHEARLYNCSASYADRPEFFQEAMYLLLCGCGVGFSVQKHHVAKLPGITHRSRGTKVYEVPDSIEGWSDAFGVLISSYIEESWMAPFPEYSGYKVVFDLSKIRPKGAFISGGFKAPGPEPLRNALQRCEALMDRELDQGATHMRPIVVYDFTMHMADAVLAGGVRRSATICLFSEDDEEMLNAKTGDWFITNPQRARSNNSVILLRNTLSWDAFQATIEKVKEFGEPGFIFTDDLEFLFNPCVEIGMRGYTLFGESGFQMCNLTEINGDYCTSLDRLLEASRASAILGTLQAGYTNFTYLSEATRHIVEREALLGCSITGWMNNPEVLFHPDNMIRAAEEVKKVNNQIAALIGINPAARTTCVKPSGNASILLGTASGIHGEHARKYLRNVQLNESDAALEIIQKYNPVMVEDSLWNPNGTDKVVSFPIVTRKDSILKQDLLGVKQLEYVKLAQQFWVEYGTREWASVDPRLRHNVSNTITVDDWDAVAKYLYENRQWFAGVSLLPARGDKAYAQAPFTEVLDASEILVKYGDAAIFASGLIVDGLHAFHDNLWRACDTVLGFGEKLHASHSRDLYKRDWVRRAINFANHYFGGNLVLMTDCLKDVHNFHKWKTIERQIVDIDFAKEMTAQQYTDINTMSAQACSGGVCELTF